MSRPSDDPRPNPAERGCLIDGKAIAYADNGLALFELMRGRRHDRRAQRRRIPDRSYQGQAGTRPEVLALVEADCQRSPDDQFVDAISNTYSKWTDR
jgi:hypothetical protein